MKDSAGTSRALGCFTITTALRDDFSAGPKELLVKRIGFICSNPECRQATSGLQASYLNQPIQVASLRNKLQNLAGSGFPQILLRPCHPADVVPASPRRDVADVIEEASVQSRGRGRSS